MAVISRIESIGGGWVGGDRGEVDGKAEGGLKQTLKHKWQCCATVDPVVAKILEKIVATQLGVYLERNNLLHPHQGAYRCGKSTEDILLLAVDYIATLLDKGSVVCAAFINLRKAFDSLDHCLLLQRISDLGGHCQVLEWFKNYLTDRYHRVKAAGIFSSWRLMKGGIPQGSALGPLMFLIYMNSLPSQLTDGLLLQYADDTTVICSGVDPMHCCSNNYVLTTLINTALGFTE